MRACGRAGRHTDTEALGGLREPWIEAHAGLEVSDGAVVVAYIRQDDAQVGVPLRKGTLFEACHRRALTHTHTHTHSNTNTHTHTLFEA